LCSDVTVNIDNNTFWVKQKPDTLHEDLQGFFFFPSDGICIGKRNFSKYCRKE
jgi:hypothetical protein